MKKLKTKTFPVLLLTLVLLLCAAFALFPKHRTTAGAQPLNKRVAYISQTPITAIEESFLQQNFTEYDRCFFTYNDDLEKIAQKTEEYIAAAYDVIIFDLEVLLPEDEVFGETLNTCKDTGIATMLICAENETYLTTGYSYYPLFDIVRNVSQFQNIETSRGGYIRFIQGTVSKIAKDYDTEQTINILIAYDFYDYYEVRGFGDFIDSLKRELKNQEINNYRIIVPRDWLNQNNSEFRVIDSSGNVSIAAFGSGEDITYGGEQLCALTPIPVDSYFQSAYLNSAYYSTYNYDGNFTVYGIIQNLNFTLDPFSTNCPIQIFGWSYDDSGDALHGPDGTEESYIPYLDALRTELGNTLVRFLNGETVD